jgi:hypothetical protein
MTKHLLRWKNVDCRINNDLTLSLPVPTEIDGYYKGTLLTRILVMRKQKPVSLETAIQMLYEYEKEAKKAGRMSNG